MIKTRHAAFFVSMLMLAACQATSPPQSAPSQNRQRLTLPTRPPLALQIDATFTPLLVMHFPIEALTDVDRYVFVDADAGRAIRRMVIVQYEVVQAKSPFKFRYPPNPPALFGAYTYRHGAYVYDDERAAAGAPLKEAALTRAMLAAQGYRAPRLLRVARLARVADSEGQSEVIIFYLENADGAYPTGPLQGADEDGDLILDTAAKDAIFGRLRSVVQPLTGCCH